MESETQQPEKDHSFSFGEQLAFFLIPILGMMVYATTLSSNPEKAKYALGVSMVPIILFVGIWLVSIMF